MKNGSIKAFLTMIDAGRLGIEWYKISLTLNDFRAAGRILKFASAHPKVTSAYEMLAGGELELEVEAYSPRELEEFLDELTRKFPEEIRHYDFFLFTTEHKSLSMPSTQGLEGQPAKK